MVKTAYIDHAGHPHDVNTVTNPRGSEAPSIAIGFRDDLEVSDAAAQAIVRAVHAAPSGTRPRRPVEVVDESFLSSR